MCEGAPAHCSEQVCTENRATILHLLTLMGSRARNAAVGNPITALDLSKATPSITKLEVGTRRGLVGD